MNYQPPKSAAHARAILDERKAIRDAHIDIYKALALFDHHEPRSASVIIAAFKCGANRAAGVLTKLKAEGLVREWPRHRSKVLLTERGMERLGKSLA